MTQHTQALRRSVRQKKNATQRARELRSQQNKRAYQIRKQNKAPATRSTPAVIFRRIPRVPGLLREMAKAAPNVRTRLFGHYSRSNNSQDNEQFAPWMKLPPYTFTPTQLRQGLFDTISSVQGYQHRIHREFDTKRLSRYHSYSLATFSQEVYADIELKILEFRQGRKVMRENQENWCNMNILMAETFLQWKARRVMALIEDYKALKKGNDWILVVYGERWGKGY